MQGEEIAPCRKLPQRGAKDLPAHHAVAIVRLDVHRRTERRALQF